MARINIEKIPEMLEKVDLEITKLESLRIELQNLHRIHSLVPDITDDQLFLREKNIRDKLKKYPPIEDIIKR